LSIWSREPENLRGATLLLLCALTACGATPVKAPVGDRTDRPLRHPAVHLVRPGDTLYSVAFLYGYSVKEVARWNGIAPPYTIYKGQRLRLTPPVASKRATRPSAAKPAKPKRVRPSRPKLPRARPSQPKLPASVKARTESDRHAAKPPPKPARPAPNSAPAVSKGPPPWSWPAGGRLIQRYNPTSSGKKGIDISGRKGEPVRAAAPGKVVYAGSGLSGYGRLIIVKHNNDFLSAYAHNRKLIAKEGQWVTTGETIALMGSSGTDRTKLHFEIRKGGRPVDPLRYLPRR
jgi:lipoprotein NlpD